MPLIWVYEAFPPLAPLAPDCPSTVNDHPRRLVDYGQNPEKLLLYTFYCRFRNRDPPSDLSCTVCQFCNFVRCMDCTTDKIGLRRHDGKQKATILVKKLVTRTTVFHEVWRLFESFSIAGPAAWNSLPDQVKNASSLETFKAKLKTHHFKQSYNCHSFWTRVQRPFLWPRLCYSAI